jgi:hypothetical protein
LSGKRSRKEIRIMESSMDLLIWYSNELEQGWDLLTMFKLACEYVDSQGKRKMKEFDDFLAKRVEDDSDEEQP